MRVLKYEVMVGPRTDVEMPVGATVLCVQTQRRGGEGFQPEAIMLWALVDDSPGNPRVWRSFEVVGTGHQTPAPPLLYVGTVQFMGGALVWHVFEVTL